jgi:hypothetical protein
MKTKSKLWLLAFLFTACEKDNLSPNNNTLPTDALHIKRFEILTRDNPQIKKDITGLVETSSGEITFEINRIPDAPYIDITKLKPRIELYNDNSVISPASLVAQDFSQSGDNLLYTVSYQGKQKTYKVKVKYVSADASIQKNFTVSFATSSTCAYAIVDKTSADNGIIGIAESTLLQGGTFYVYARCKPFSIKLQYTMPSIFSGFPELFAPTSPVEANIRVIPDAGTDYQNRYKFIWIPA